MDRTRYNALMSDEEVHLSEQEVKEGWHFCNEWDGLLVGPGMGELEPCRCWAPWHPVYKTIPTRIGPAFPIPLDWEDTSHIPW